MLFIADSWRCTLYAPNHNCLSLQGHKIRERCNASSKLGSNKTTAFCSLVLSSGFDVLLAAMLTQHLNNQLSSLASLALILHKPNLVFESTKSEA